MLVVQIAVVSGLCIAWASAANLRATSTVAKIESEIKSNDNGPCQSDLFEVCNLPYPTTYQGIFDARMCLWANKEKVTQQCLHYLLKESPSIIEPCYDPIAKFCHDVVPGENRIHNCLREKVVKPLTSECQQIIDRDFQWSSTLSNDSKSKITYEEDSGDDYVSSNPDYDDIDTITSEDEKYAEEAAEFAYLMKKLHHQMETDKTPTDKSEVASKLLDVVAFQDFLASFSVLPVMQQLHGFLGHINEELGMLEGYLFKMLSSADLPDQGESMTSNIEVEESYYYESDDYEKNKKQVITTLSNDCEGGDDCMGSENNSAHMILPEVITQERDDAVSEEDIVTGDHIFRESQLASTLTTDDEEWRKASKMFSLPTILPLSTESLFNAPKQLMQVMVQTTMNAKVALASSSTVLPKTLVAEASQKREEQTQLRGSLLRTAIAPEENHQSSLFLEYLRAMVHNALQDPRQ